MVGMVVGTVVGMVVGIVNMWSTCGRICDQPGDKNHLKRHQDVDIFMMVYRDDVLELIGREPERYSTTVTKEEVALGSAWPRGTAQYR